MTIKINGIRYTTPEALQAIDNPDVVTFLQEWYDDKNHVTGHTSGSTGTPKTIRLSKQDMLASAKITNAYFDIHSESRLLLCLSPSYIAGKMMIVRGILAGADLIVVPPSSSPLKHLEQDIDFAAMVPMQVETCLTTLVRQRFWQEDAIISNLIIATRSIVTENITITTTQDISTIHVLSRPLLDFNRWINLLTS